MDGVLRPERTKHQRLGQAQPRVRIEQQKHPERAMQATANGLDHLMAGCLALSGRVDFVDETQGCAALALGFDVPSFQELNLESGVEITKWSACSLEQ